MKRGMGIPKACGLYSPEAEKDNCGVGFITKINGERSHEVIKKGVDILKRLEHRGAVGADPLTGDGAGILMQIPDEFFRNELKKDDIVLPKEGNYGVGMVFFPRKTDEILICEGIIEKIINEENQEILGWREVPTDPSEIGETAASTSPVVKQVFIKKGANTENFALQLYIIRRRIEKAILDSVIKNKESFYIPSLSNKIIIYKGLLLSAQISNFYKDLNNKSMKSAIALVHQRYSTNTFPSWDLAQPFRLLAHNGEINTIKGNLKWMAARKPELNNDVFKDQIKKVLPVTNKTDSDSANLDHVFELMVAAGIPLAEAITTLVPEAWEKNSSLDNNLKSYYEYNSNIVEPWDGPAAIAFSDGKKIGATLDRNGLRPARYIRTKDGFFVLASEIGTLEISPNNILESGRLEPGKMLIIDTEKGEVFYDKEVKKELSLNKPYTKWIKDNKKYLKNIKMEKEKYSCDLDTVITRLRAFGYSREDLSTIIAPMAENQKEDISSMGNDEPLAVLSNKSKLLYDYFKQLFAQVTNPPIDPIRENVVMSLKTNLGTKGNMLERTEDKSKAIEIDSPILDNSQLAKIAHLKETGFRSKTIPMIFDPQEENGLKKGLEKMFGHVESSISEGYNIIILSDRTVDDFNAPIPSLLATSALHNYLINKNKRSNVDIIIESGEAREVMHFALLLGYGALAINPYLAFESIEYMTEEELYLTKGDSKHIKKRKKKYIKAIHKGLFKVMSKMGISTIQSYRGAQIFEAVGLQQEFINKYFPGTVSRIEGVGIDTIGKEIITNHNKAYKNNRKIYTDLLESSGKYKWREGGEYHLLSPEAISTLQHAVMDNDYEKYKKYANLINDQSENLATIRGLFKFKNKKSIPLDKVESVESIRKRFVTGAMSYGSISKEAHETLAKAMNKIGGMSNSGEGGENPERFKDDRRSAIKQVASGRFGVTTYYLVNGDEIQIKMAQGAKPGEGGHLPGKKVNEEIAKVRYTSPGIDLISPPPHHDIYSIEDLAQLIFDLKNVNPEARISVKLVSENGIGTIAAGVSKAHADMILVSGHDGGTGAAPLNSIKHTGLPWELGLSETHQVLTKNNLRGRVRVQADGQMKTGRDVAIAALLGAEEYGFATIALVTMGCIMMRQCQKNTCPVGVATQDPELRKRFSGHVDYVVNYFTFVAQEIREIMAELGFKTIDEMIGRVDKLEMDRAIKHWKAEGVDLSNILYKDDLPSRIATRCVEKQDHGIDKILDRTLIKKAKPALENKEKVNIDVDIFNTNRTAGTMLSGQIAKIHGENGLKDDTININLKGYAGQSFGAFGMKGLTLNLEGQGNDYIGKGLFGAKIIIKKPTESNFNSEENVIAGNTILYGAIRGQLYVNGLAGERFGVRNSGAHAVVEGIGEHGCEYMTGGQIAVLGKTGKNFGAGMSGGIAYVYDIDGDFQDKVNTDTVKTEVLASDEDISKLKTMIENHVKYTDSNRAKDILDNWDENINKFIKVINPAYEQLLEKKKEENNG
ncbi:MAG: glutamate synthase large subunit [Fusobacteriota bacterium]